MLEDAGDMDALQAPERLGDAGDLDTLQAPKCLWGTSDVIALQALECLRDAGAQIPSYPWWERKKNPAWGC